MTNRQKGGAAAVGGALLLAATLTVVPNGHESLGAALVASGFSTAAYVSSTSGSAGTSAAQPVTLTAVLPWTAYGAGGDLGSWDAGYVARYGVHTSPAFGSPALRAVCRPSREIDGPIVEAVVRHGTNPLNMAGHGTWEYDRDAWEDLKLLARPGAGCGGLAWDQLILPLYASLTAVPPATPTPAPEPPPQPTPEPPAPSSYGWSVRQTDCGIAMLGVCLSVRFIPSTASTGRLTVTVADE